MVFPTLATLWLGVATWLNRLADRAWATMTVSLTSHGQERMLTLTVSKSGGARLMDLDVSCRRAAPGWGAVARSLLDAVDPEICGRQIGKAMAKHLRQSGGLESRELADLLPEYGGDAAAHREAVESALERLVRRLVADRVLPGLVGSAYATVADAERHLARCMDAAQLPQLAQSLLRHPDGVGVRQAGRPREALKHLLVEPAPLGAWA